MQISTYDFDFIPIFNPTALEEGLFCKIFGMNIYYMLDIDR